MKLFALIAVLALSSCAAHMHTVGHGTIAPEGHQKVETARQFYILNWQPLNEVDTKEMAGGAENYEIKTSETLTDIVISVLTFQIITSRTVEVIRNPVVKVREK